MSISAKIVADSISPSGVRLTTMELNYHRFIHSEFMTHRMFSRNASSSRAIPIEKMLKQVQENPAMPVHWGKNQSGMQAREEIASSQVSKAKDWWGGLSSEAIYCVEGLSNLGVHKQIVNRLLEPFQWIKVIVTATEWDNFFKLRLHPDAQPEMMVLAERMKEAMEDSTPKELAVGEWHTPYYYGSFTDEKGNSDVGTALKCSVARCARVSYLNHDNTNPNIEKDLSLADMLLKAGHMSPMEHQATPMEYKYESDIPEQHWPIGYTHSDREGYMWSGNFRGFLQYRQLIS